MTSTIIVGDVGSGKTLFQTYLCVSDHRPVYANYEIKIDRWSRLQPQMIFELQDCLVVMDEMYLWLEARVSSNQLNEYLSYMLFQSRKNGTDYIGTAQLFRTIDVRFREMADFIVIAKNDKKNKVFRYEMLKNSSVHPIIKKFEIPYDRAKEIFSLYDTKEKIPISPDILGGAITDKRTILPEVETHIERMLKMGPARSWSRSAVDGYCVRNNLSKVHSSTIYNELRLRSINHHY